MNDRDRRESDERAVGLMLSFIGVLVSLPAVVLGVLAVPLVKGRRVPAAILALLGIAVTVGLHGAIVSEMEAALRDLHRAGGLVTRPDRGLGAVWPHMRSWWLLALGLAPAVACGIELFRAKSVEELREREERRAERAGMRRERRARKQAGVEKPAKREPRFELGRRVDGDDLLPVRRGRVMMPLERLARTALVIGAPGSGKTVTLARLALGVASASDWSVVVIDAKGDPDTQAGFAASMEEAGRTPRLFPQERYDGFRGSGREVTNRLVQLIDWAEEGGGTYYRDLSVNLVRAACTAPQGPPRSSAELLERLDKGTLIDLWAGHAPAAEMARYRDEHVDACRQRYASFFHAVEGQLDGSLAFEDADCAYLLLNELSYGEETGKLGRFLVEDFKQYVASRKDHRHQVLLIVDEFSAIADGERMARMVETVRSYGAAVVLAPQAYEGMGGEEASARILNAAHTVFLHSVPDPEPIVKAAGTRMAVESSLQHEGGVSTELGSARVQHQLRADPNEVRRLPPGMCFVIGSGQAQKIQVAPTTTTVGRPRPQATTGELPLRTVQDDPIRL